MVFMDCIYIVSSLTISEPLNNEPTSLFPELCLVRRQHWLHRWRNLPRFYVLCMAQGWKNDLWTMVRDSGVLVRCRVFFEGHGLCELNKNRRTSPAVFISYYLYLLFLYLFPPRFYFVDICPILLQYFQVQDPL